MSFKQDGGWEEGTLKAKDGAPSLKVFIARLDEALGRLVSWKASLTISGGVGARC